MVLVLGCVMRSCSCFAVVITLTALRASRLQRSSRRIAFNMMPWPGLINDHHEDKKNGGCRFPGTPRGLAIELERCAFGVTSARIVVQVVDFSEIKAEGHIIAVEPTLMVRPRGKHAGLTAPVLVDQTAHVAETTSLQEQPERALLEQQIDT